MDDATSKPRALREGGYRVVKASSRRLGGPLSHFTQETRTVGDCAAEDLRDCLPHVRQRIAYAQIHSRATRRRVGQDGHILPRMICSLPTQIRVATMVRG